MGQAKEKWIEAQLKDTTKWITRKCAVCNKPVKINVILDRKDADLKEQFTCKECLNKD